MRAIVNSTYVTLDGVISDPQDWPALSTFGGVGADVQSDLLLRCDGVLMGRATYESFAPVWSPRSGDAVTDRMNAIPKYVVSTTLTDPEWHNTTVIKDDPVQRIRQLKEEPGGDLVQYGFGPLAHALMAAGLLDELRLWVHPFFVGTSSDVVTLHRPGSTGMFDLHDSSIFPNGLVILTYRRTERADG